MQLILVGKEVIVLLLYLVLLTAVIVLTIRTIVSDCNSDIQMAKPMSIWLFLTYSFGDESETGVIVLMCSLDYNKC